MWKIIYDPLEAPNGAKECYINSLNIAPYLVCIKQEIENYSDMLLFVFSFPPSPKAHEILIDLQHLKGDVHIYCNQWTVKGRVLETVFNEEVWARFHLQADKEYRFGWKIIPNRGIAYEPF